MLDLANYLPYLINRAGTRLAVNFGRALKGRVAVQEWRVLAALIAHGPQRLSDLAALTSIDLSTLSRLVGRMVRGKLVVRGRGGQGDRREVLVSLSAKGEKLTRDIVPMAQRYERVSLRGLSEDEARTLKRLLVRVYENLDALERDG